MLNRCDFRCVLKVENFRDKCRSDLLEGSSSTWTGDGKSTVAYGWARRIWHQNFSRECRTYVDGFEVLNRVTREWRTVGGWWGLQVRGDMPWMYPPPGDYRTQSDMVWVRVSASFSNFFYAGNLNDLYNNNNLQVGNSQNRG